MSHLGHDVAAVVEAHPAFAIEPASPELVARTEAADWPEGLLDRVLGLRRDRAIITEWLDSGFPTPEMLEAWVGVQEMLLNSTLTARQATWEDGELLADLCAGAPEDVGEWTVTVERSPNPYAQYRLQEHPNIIILEDRRVGLGMCVHSVRNTIIAGQRTSAHLMSGWRIRNGFRGLGLSKILQFAPGPGAGWFGLITYYYVRDGNASASWVSKINSEMADRPEGWAVDTGRLTASVTYFGHPERGRRSARVRAAGVADLDRCRALINRTHDGLDLFRPYSEEYLDVRMSDPSWGPKPPFYERVYGLDDYRVLEIGDEIVACAGLWDRGRDLREIWRRDGEGGGEEIVVDPTALMDFGFADGHDEAMGELIGHLLAESAELGRSGVLAPLEFVPEVATATAELGGIDEVRELHVTPFTSPTLTVDLPITRPYVDLAYW